MQKNASGFTLVELAIVLMIIGLLIGGVLRGLELMTNARIAATVQQARAYSGAVHTFLDAYNNLPGDFPKATSRLPGCGTGNTNSCIDGDGNGIIGDATAGPSEPQQSPGPDIALENTQFWKHLALAHMISGINPSASTYVMGQSHPASKLAGGYFVRYTNYPGWRFQWTGHIITMVNEVGPTGAMANEWKALSPNLVHRLDAKMDDGIALSGDVRCVSDNWTSGCGRPFASSGTPTTGADGYAQTYEVNVSTALIKIF